MEELLYINVNNVNLAYTRIGVGDPMILIHGNGEEHSIFDKTVDVLKDHFTCYCLDSRGHGKSTMVEEFHYQDMADDVAAFIQELGLKNVSICGFSDGGIIGLLVAIQNEEIRNLIACGANLVPTGVKMSVLAIMRAIYTFHKDPKVYLMLSEPDISTEELAKIKARTLILAGEKDLIRHDHTRKISESISGSTLRLIKGEDHGSYIVHSEKLGIIIKKWMRIK